jgi:hypothetical protein
MQRTFTARITAASIMLIAVMGAACTADEPLAGENAAQNRSVPAFNQIDDALALEGKDETVVKEALEGWRRNVATSDATRPFGQRREQELTFVATVAPSLDDRQLTNLVNLIIAQRQEQRPMRQHRGDGDRMTMLARRLDLSADQQKSLKRLHEDTRAQVDAKRAAARQGDITEDELDTQVKAIREGSHEKMATILSAEQLAKFDALRQDGMERRQERKADNTQRRNAGDRVERHIGWLDAALELTDEQAAQAKAAMTAMIETRTSVHQGRQAGTITGERARQQMRAAHTTFEETLATILTEEQAKRLAILEPLRPGRHHHA